MVQYNPLLRNPKFWGIFVHSPTELTQVLEKRDRSSAENISTLLLIARRKGADISLAWIMILIVLLAIAILSAFPIWNGNILPYWY
jgi:hypothetical protein